MLTRFHLDEHISPEIAVGLRRRNIDVKTTRDAGLAGASDETHIAFAASEGRVLITHDADFLRLHANGTAHAGIAYCPQGSLTVGEMLRRLAFIYDLFEAEEMTNRVEYL